MPLDSNEYTLTDYYSALSTRTSMHQALQIPEVVRVILDFLEQPKRLSTPTDLTNCTTVCRLWSDVSLDILWYSVSDFLRFAQLLGSVKPGFRKSHLYEFESLPTTENWKRFQLHYSHRVFRLSVCPLLISPRELFGPIASTRPTHQPIFPNLQALCWSCIPCDAALMFMHENVTELSLLWRFRGRLPTDLVDFIPLRMPSLRFLRLEIKSDRQHCQIVTEMVKQLPCLTSLHISAFSDISDLVSSVGRMTKLQNLSITSGEQGCILGQDQTLRIDCIPHEAPPQFASLSSLIITVPYTTITAFLLIGPFLLTTIKIQSLLQEPAENHTHLFGAIAKTCPLLECLHVKCAVEGSCLPPRSQYDFVSFADIQPLTQCRYMRDILVQHTYPLHLCTADIRKLAHAWQFLESVVLSPRQNSVLGNDWQHGKDLGISSVLCFARFCPGLRRLGLFLTIRSDEIPTAVELNLLTPFSSLQFLDVGNSEMPIAVAVDMATFLDKILPPYARIIHDKTGRFRAEWGVTEDTLTAVFKRRLRS